MDVTKEFVLRLRELLELETRAEFNSDEWKKLSREFVMFVRANHTVVDLMNEEIWHYTADLGIRKKDQHYAAQQRDYVIKFIEKIEGADPDWISD